MSSPPKNPVRTWLLKISLLIIPVNIMVFLAASRSHGNFLYVVFSVLAAVQFSCAIVCVFCGKGFTIPGILVSLAALVGWVLGSLVMGLGGAAWGRPLRVRGRQIHARIAPGDAWAAGQRPSAVGLDPATAQALEALWLHDAQKEHASVPAFARVTWLLIAAGAPGDLLAWSQRACGEEIAHARLCFALAAGYGVRPHTALPMPELLGCAMDGVRSAARALAVESVRDGCLLEDYNADVAAACVRVCEEPSPRAVLEQIAREERSHAAFSWAVLRWCLATHRAEVLAAVHQATDELARSIRPTAVNDAIAPLVAAADQEVLRRHGRIPDALWAELWERRLMITRERLERLLEHSEGIADDRRHDQLAHRPLPVGVQ